MIRISSEKNTSEFLNSQLFISGGTEKQTVVGREKLQARVDQLQPFTNYTFYLVSYTSQHHSSHSQTITQQTDEDSK